MLTKTDIEIIFSSPSQAVRAGNVAKTIIFVYFQNAYELLPFEKQTGQMLYHGRNVSCEDFSSYSALWREYRLTHHCLKYSGSLDIGHRKEGQDMIGKMVLDGRRLLLCDCSGIQMEHHIVGSHEDFFSMLCLMLAATVPGIQFEGLCCSANPGHYTKRYLTHVICDDRTLTFEHSEGDPVYHTSFVSWTRTEKAQIFRRETGQFPSVLVSIITDDKEGLKQDREISRWVGSVNQVRFSEEARLEMISAEPLYEWSMFADIMLRAPSRKVCEKYRDSLIALLKINGYQTRVFSLLRENECVGAHVQIPDSVTCIGKNAFRSHSELQSVVIPCSVTAVHENAFEYCSSLKEITIPDSVTRIECFAFSKCENLQTVTLSRNLEKLETSLFSYCENLESIQIPAGVTEIERFVFHNCKKLKNVVIPEKVRKIDDKAFEGCENLESVFIPAGVKEIGEAVFIKCSPDLILYGEKGSAAERYAVDNGLSFAETQQYQSGNNTESDAEKKKECG